MTGGAGSAEGKAKAGEGEKGAVGDPSKRPVSNYNYDEAVLKVQEWNEALKCESSSTIYNLSLIFPSSSITTIEASSSWPSI